MSIRGAERRGVTTPLFSTATGDECIEFLELRCFGVSPAKTMSTKKLARAKKALDLMT